MARLCTSRREVDGRETFREVPGGILGPEDGEGGEGVWEPGGSGIGGGGAQAFRRAARHRLYLPWRALGGRQASRERTMVGVEKNTLVEHLWTSVVHEPAQAKSRPRLEPARLVAPWTRDSSRAQTWTRADSSRLELPKNRQETAKRLVYPCPSLMPRESSRLMDPCSS